jgi:GT2 family glycosyltransferase
MHEEGAVWVGMLDIDGSGPVVGMSGPGPAGYSNARVLIRMHRAPLGQVSVATLPAETFTARVRMAAETELAGAVRQHADWDSSSCGPTSSGEWVAQAACPRHFPVRNGAGVTIIVCTRDRTEGLRECLRTLQQVSYDPVEIIVVDNAPSGSATREAVTELAEIDPRIRYSSEPFPGLSRARNHGMAHAQFDVVAFTDDDTVVDPGWPSVLAAGFAADPEAVCVTGLVASAALDTSSQRYFDARIPWGDQFEPRRYDLIGHRHPSRMYPFKAGMFGTGANFAVRRSAVARLGGFDPLLGVGAPSRGGEDLDIFLRLILAGGRICYLPSALIWHRHRADAGALSEQLYSYGHGLGAYVAKHLPNRDLRHALVAHGAGQASALLSRMGRASRLSEPPGGGKRLAWTEASGVLAGALCYRRAARQARSGPGAP